jgi:hypothetical protein
MQLAAREKSIVATLVIHRPMFVVQIPGLQGLKDLLRDITTRLNATGHIEPINAEFGQ